MLARGHGVQRKGCCHLELAERSPRCVAHPMGDSSTALGMTGEFSSSSSYRSVGTALAAVRGHGGSKKRIDLSVSFADSRSQAVRASAYPALCMRGNLPLSKGRQEKCGESPTIVALICRGEHCSPADTGCDRGGRARLAPTGGGGACFVGTALAAVRSEEQRAGVNPAPTEWCGTCFVGGVLDGPQTTET